MISRILYLKCNRAYVSKNILMKYTDLIQANIAIFISLYGVCDLVMYSNSTITQSKNKF